MSKKQHKRSHRGSCDHAATVTTLNAGMERVVCESCGDVTISYHHDFVFASAAAEAAAAREGRAETTHLVRHISAAA